MRIISCGAITAGNSYPVILLYLFIQFSGRSPPTRLSGFQMPFLIQFIKPITPGNCFLIVIPWERRKVSPPVLGSVSALAEVRSPEESVPCMKLREGNSCPEPGGSFHPSLRLSTSFKSLNVSLLLLTSHHHPSQWSLWETSSLSLSYLHPSIFSSSHDCFLS